MPASVKRAAAIAALSLAACVPVAVAQTGGPGPGPPKKTAPTPEPAPTPKPAAPSALPPRPTVAVMDFDYGTLATPWWGQYDIGHGVATQLVDVLLEDGRLRLIERSMLAAVLGEQDFAASERASPEAAKLARVGKVLGVRYVVAGSITKFATSDRKFGGGKVGAVARGVLGPIGGLSFRKARQEVALTARFIDTTTGEVVVSAQAEGVARKGQGAAVEGGGAGGIGFATESPEFRASGIAEAQGLAVAALAQGLLQHVAELSVEVPKPDPPPAPEPTPAPTPAPKAKPKPTRKAAPAPAAPAAKPPVP